MKQSKKLLSLALAFCMVIGLVIPATALPEEDYDPYIFVWNSPVAAPDTVVEGLPDYYLPYAGRYTYYSPLFCGEAADGDAHVCCVFNMVNYSELIQEEALAPEGAYASTWSYCADMDTSTVAGTTYRRLNLEDGYFSFDEDGNYVGGEIAGKVRAVVRHSFPYINDISAVQDAANAYLTETYGDEAVLIDGLTGAQLVSATQTAIWHYTNGVEFESPYPYIKRYDATWWSEDSVNEILDTVTVDLFEEENEKTAWNIRGVYEYLTGLAGEDSRDVSVTDSTIQVVGTTQGVKNGNMFLTVYFTLDATIDGDDSLILTVSLGDHTKTCQLGENTTITPDENGVYAVTFSGLGKDALTDDTLVSLSLSGTQNVKDVCLYEAKPAEGKTARKTAQNFVGYCGGSAPVYCDASYAIAEDTYKTGALYVNKSVVNSSAAQDWEQFDFQLSLDFSDVSVPAWVTEEYQIGFVSANQDLAWEKTADGKYSASFTLRADETISVFGLPVGAKYTLREIVEEEGWVKLNVTSEILSGDGTANDAIVSGDISEINSVRFTNTFVVNDLGSLNVSKKLVNTSAAQEWESFDFRLVLDFATADVHSFGNSRVTDAYLLSLVESTKELTWVPENGKYVAQFTLQADETVIFEGISVGTGFVLEEILSDTDRESFTVSVQIVEGDGDICEGVVSSVIANRNSLIYTNTVQNNSGEGEAPDDGADLPSDSGEDETEPSVEVTDPTEEVTDPTEEVTVPSGGENKPFEDVAVPSEDVTDSTEGTLAPSGEGDKPSEDVAAPSEDAAEPSEGDSNDEQAVPETGDNSVAMLAVAMSVAIAGLAVLRKKED